MRIISLKSSNLNETSYWKSGITGRSANLISFIYFTSADDTVMANFLTLSGSLDSTLVSESTTTIMEDVSEILSNRPNADIIQRTTLLKNKTPLHNKRLVFLTDLNPKSAPISNIRNILNSCWYPSHERRSCRLSLPSPSHPSRNLDYTIIIPSVTTRTYQSKPRLQIIKLLGTSPGLPHSNTNRPSIELHWIVRLKTTQPHGITDKSELGYPHLPYCFTFLLSGYLTSDSRLASSPSHFFLGVNSTQTPYCSVLRSSELLGLLTCAS